MLRPARSLRDKEGSKFRPGLFSPPRSLRRLSSEVKFRAGAQRRAHLRGASGLTCFPPSLAASLQAPEEGRALLSPDSRTAKQGEKKRRAGRLDPPQEEASASASGGEGRLPGSRAKSCGEDDHLNPAGSELRTSCANTDIAFCLYFACSIHLIPFSKFFLLPVVADVLSEFLEVAVHLILYVREVYPTGIFQKRKKYNVPVQMSCHPELNQYIQDTLHCIKPLLEKNDVEKVVVVILDKEHHPVERFVFEIMQPPLLSISSDSLLNHVEQLLRAFILKISVCDAVLDNNPPGCTFTVLVHTREAATRNMEKIQVIKDFPWILADEQDVHMQDPRLIPLKTMTSDLLKVSGAHFLQRT
ncbi:hypothetical protein lerEdw1_003112 [Lerista edwardsae]|nr:hypothetical protein lerEdw1_003112 [Lerista edwardsae]